MLVPLTKLVIITGLGEAHGLTFVVLLCKSWMLSDLEDFADTAIKLVLRINIKRTRPLL